MKKLENIIKSARKKIILTFLFVVNTFYGMTVKANALENTTAYTGTKNLFSDLTTVLTAFLVILTFALSAWRFIKLQHAEEGEETRAKKKLIATIVIGILGSVFTGLLAVIFHYYGVATP